MISQTVPRPTEQYMRNCKWIADHINELVRAHGNGWIAVDREQVLAAGLGLDEVTRNAEQSAAPAGDIVYEFIDDGTLIF